MAKTRDHRRRIMDEAHVPAEGFLRFVEFWNSLNHKRKHIFSSMIHNHMGWEEAMVQIGSARVVNPPKATVAVSAAALPMALMLIMILLLIAGIEPNPGFDAEPCPHCGDAECIGKWNKVRGRMMLKCKSCTATLYTSANPNHRRQGEEGVGSHPGAVVAHRVYRPVTQSTAAAALPLGGSSVADSKDPVVTPGPATAQVGTLSTPDLPPAAAVPVQTATATCTPKAVRKPDYVHAGTGYISSEDVPPLCDDKKSDDGPDMIASNFIDLNAPDSAAESYFLTMSNGIIDTILAEVGHAAAKIPGMDTVRRLWIRAFDPIQQAIDAAKDAMIHSTFFRPLVSDATEDFRPHNDGRDKRFKPVIENEPAIIEVKSVERRADLDGQWLDETDAARAMSMALGYYVRPDQCKIRHLIVPTTNDYRLISMRHVPLVKGTMVIGDVEARTHVPFRMQFAELLKECQKFHNSDEFIDCFLHGLWNMKWTETVNHLKYAPHLVSCAASEFNFGTTTEVVQSNVLAKLLRSVAAPLVDREALDIFMGSSIAVVVVVMNRSFFSRPAGWNVRLSAL